MDYDTTDVSGIIQRMSAIVNASKDIHKDEAAKKALLDVNRELETSLRHPYEMISCWAFMPGHMTCIVLAADLGIFEALTEGPKSISELAALNHADEELVRLVLRTLISMRFASRTDDRYCATDLTNHISKPSVIAGVRHFFANLSAYHAMPEFFKKNGYKLPESSSDGPLQLAHNTKKPAYALWDEQGLLENFNIFMKGHFAPPSILSWLDWFSIESLLNGFDKSISEYVFVDVGGGKGHEGELLLQKYPSASIGKFVLQDLPPVINGITTLDPRIEKCEYDFTKPQPVKSARIYYLKDILHNYSDTQCLDILKQLKTAMLPGYSKLLVCNIIMSEDDASLRQTGLDIAMLTLHGGKQRDQVQWRGLLEQSGFKLIDFHLPPGDGDGIIEAEVA